MQVGQVYEQYSASHASSLHKDDCEDDDYLVVRAEFGEINGINELAELHD
jgi:hypothetical protein